MKLFPIMLAGTAAMLLAGCNEGPGEARNQTAQEVASEMKKISMKPGEWETTQEVIDVKIEGAPEGMPTGIMEAMKGRKNTVKTCITPEQAANPSADFLTSQKDSKCTYSGFEMNDGKIKGAVSCPSPEGGKADIALDGNYSSEGYQMNMEMKTAGMGGDGSSNMTMHMKMRTTGKRVGECTQAQEGTVPEKQ